MEMSCEKMRKFGFGEKTIAKIEERMLSSGKGGKASTYEWKYAKYLKKRIRLSTAEGVVITGVVDEVSSPGDNENGEEGVLVDSENHLIEIFDHEIKSIEILE